jgi:hypothetical protein
MNRNSAATAGACAAVAVGTRVENPTITPHRIAVGAENARRYLHDRPAVPRAAPRKVPAQANAAWAALHDVRRVRRRRAVLPRGRARLAVRRVPAAAPSRRGLTPPPSRGSVRTSAAPLIGLLA